MPEEQSKEKAKPIRPNGYASHLSGNWDDVPEWAIKRINFLEEHIQRVDLERCPKMYEPCPNTGDISCHAVKHCFPYICDGSCGHSEIWVSDEEKKILQQHRDKL